MNLRRKNKKRMRVGMTKENLPIMTAGFAAYHVARNVGHATRAVFKSLIAMPLTAIDVRNCQVTEEVIGVVHTM